MPDDRLDAHAGQPLQAPDHLAEVFAVVAQVEREHGGLLDVVVVPTDGLAVLAQDVELAGDFGGGEKVAGVRILRDQAQGFLLPATPDPDGRMGTAKGLGRVERSLELVMLAPEGFLTAAFAFPHLQADLERFLESLEPLLDRGKRDAEAATLGFIPGSADAQPGCAGPADL